MSKRTAKTNPFKVRPESAPPSRVDRLLGVRNIEGAAIAIGNLLSRDMSAATPLQISDMCRTYGLKAEDQSALVTRLLKTSAEYFYNSDTDPGQYLDEMTMIGSSLGVTQEAVSSAITAAIRKKIRTRNKRNRTITRNAARSEDAPDTATAVDDLVRNAPLSTSNDETVRCPKCDSAQVTAGTKGFGLGKAAGGLVLAGPVGLLGGLIGSKNIMVGCLACGHRWAAGQAK
jgi:hypothetical protein